MHSHTHIVMPVESLCALPYTYSDGSRELMCIDIYIQWCQEGERMCIAIYIQWCQERERMCIAIHIQ